MTVTRVRYPLLAAWGLLLALPTFGRAHRVASADWLLLRWAGRTVVGLTAVSPLHVYANRPDIQVGPPGLAVDGAAQAIFGSTGGDYAVLVLIVGLGVVCVWAIDGLAKFWGLANPQLRLVVGLAFMTVWASMGGWGHIEDALAITGVLLAARSIPTGRGWLVGMLLGAAVASKPWAVVAAPMLLALPNRQALRAAAVFVLAAVVPWLPFLAADHHTLDIARMRWPVDNGSALHTLGFSGLSPHWLRQVQLGAGVAVGLVIARRAWWAVPLAGFAVKLALDPGVWPYYGLPVIAAAALVDTRRGRMPWWTLSAIVVEYIAPAGLPDGASGVVRLAAAIGALVLVARLTDRDSHRDPRAAVGVGGGARSGRPRRQLGFIDN